MRSNLKRWRLNSMKLYHVSQDINNNYDTYSDFVVAAESEDEARNTHPSEFVTHRRDGLWYGTHIDGGEYETDNTYRTWVTVEQLDKVEVKYIGKAADGVKGIICKSFHAG